MGGFYYERKKVIVLLPELKIPISIEVFETNLEYFINEYVLSCENPNLQFEKCKIGFSGHRYTIYSKQKDSLKSNPVKIGEIDVFKIYEEKVEIKAAVYDIENSKECLKFFNEFYYMVFNKWHIVPKPFKGHILDDSVATNSHIITGMETGYFRLPGVLQKMPESEVKYWDEGKENNVTSQSNDFYPSVSNSEREQIIQTYKTQINKGLPEKFEVSKLPTEKLNKGVPERIIARANRIEEIKDKHPQWSQAGVAKEFNSIKYDDDPFISVTDLQNAYKAMGWKWMRADRIW